jgi:glycosyltransferase involved in cell wall biosynthesis
VNIPVLYLSYDGLTDSLGQSQVLPYIVGLSKLGYSFTIVSCEKPHNYILQKEVVQQICTTNNINWHPIPYTAKPKVLSTVYDVWHLYSTVQKLHKRYQFKLIHCRSYITALIGLWCKSKYNIPFVFDMRGFWADERVDGGIWNLGNPIFKVVYNYFKKKEKEFLLKSNAIVSLTHAAKQEMLTWQLGISADKINVIPCCVDLQLFTPHKIQANVLHNFRTQLGIAASDNVLGYLGGIDTWYMLPEMLQFFTAYQQRFVGSKFLFITHHSRSLIDEALKATSINPNDVFTIKGNRADIPHLISLCKAQLFFIKPAYSKMSSSPTKQAEIMAMGIPVFCNTKVGDTASIVTKYKSGIVLSEFTPQAYNKAINTWSRRLL